MKTFVHLSSFRLSMLASFALLIPLSSLGCSSDEGTERGASSVGDGVSDGGADAQGESRGNGSVAPSGLTTYCTLYEQCGGTYFRDAATCESEIARVYGACTRSRAAIDAYGACMTKTVTCDTWNPNADQPGSTGCADEWRVVLRERYCTDAGSK